LEAVEEEEGIPSIFILCLYGTWFNMQGVKAVFVLVTLLLSSFTFYPVMSKSGEREGQEICPPQPVHLELNFFELDTLVYGVLQNLLVYSTRNFNFNGLHNAFNTTRFILQGNSLCNVKVFLCLSTKLWIYTFQKYWVFGLYPSSWY
jgi:hypothetical protein